VSAVPILGRGAVVLFGAVLLAACSHGKEAGPQPTPAAEATTTSTTEPDFSSVKLAGIPGRTTTTLTFGPGQAALTGTVTAGGAGVAGATVRVQRIVGDREITLDLLTDDLGAWHLDSVDGGRYRVRAWRAPDLTVSQPQLFFLGATDTRLVLLPLEQVQGVGVTGAVAPSPPFLDEPAGLAVTVATRVVDDQGVIRSQPAVSVGVSLTDAGGSWELDSANPVVTDARGEVEWQVKCHAPGPQPLSVTVGGTAYPLQLPPCTKRPPPTTTTASTSSSTTSTTVRKKK